MNKKTKKVLKKSNVFEVNMDKMMELVWKDSLATFKRDYGIIGISFDKKIKKDELSLMKAKFGADIFAGSISRSFNSLT